MVGSRRLGKRGRSSDIPDGEYFKLKVAILYDGYMDVEGKVWEAFWLYKKFSTREIRQAFRSSPLLVLPEDDGGVSVAGEWDLSILERGEVLVEPGGAPILLEEAVRVMPLKAVSVDSWSEVFKEEHEFDEDDD